MLKLQWSKRSKQKPESSSGSAEVDFLDLCENSVRNIKDLVKRGHLLNLRQCQDLSSKVSETVENIWELLLYCGASVEVFRPALRSLYRYMLKAEALLRNCAEKDWCAAAVFQCRNENAFRDILLDVSLCYNAIYELAKSTSTDWNNPPEDLRQPSMSLFKPVPSSDVDEDKLDVQKRLDDLANGYTQFKPTDYLVPGKRSRTQSLAKYLLVKMCSTPSNPQEVALSKYSGILWRKVSEPVFTWGIPRFLGAGSGASGVVGTTWLGVPCAKKEFHGQVNEGFFLKEAGILAHLKHPCIVNFVCCGNGVEKGDRFIAMELMEKSLADLIEEQNGAHFPLPVVVDMIVQIARGVCYLHGRGVAHHDLKPQNVVVSRLTSMHGESYYCVKLVDFGMSKTKVEVSKVNTMSAFGIGTTRYRAPEVGRQAHPDGSGKAAWFKADVFSFAMTCTHLLSLKTPFEEMQALHELYNKLINGVRPYLSSDCPKELEVLLKDCWNTAPESRPSFKEICTRLERFKYAMLQGFVGVNESDDSNVGFDFIEGKVEEESSYQVLLGDTIDDGKEGKLHNGELQILSCPFGHAPQYLPYPQSWPKGGYCSICGGEVAGTYYQCRSCDYDAHLHCSQLKPKVDVFFHKHPLHLLIRNYYNGDPEAICSFCEEPVQHSEWVYRCDECDIDVHALCTKYLEEKLQTLWHEHRLVFKQCPPRKVFSCACCNGAIRSNTWRYTCHEKCSLDVHPCCLTNPLEIVCVFHNAHYIRLRSVEEHFYCGICGGYGFSWYYQCEDCDVNIHLDCMHDILEGGNSNEIYEDYMTKHMNSNDIHVEMITQILDKVIVSDNLGESSSSTLGPTPEVELGSIRRVQPTIRRLASSETLHLDAMHSDDVDLCNKIAAETAERKAKRMTAKAGRLDSKVKYLKMLENLERMVLDLRSSESVLRGDGEVLDARLEKLKTRKYSVEDEMASLVQSRMRHGPRTCLFHVDKYKNRTVWELLTSLRADMEGVRVMFLCEEPGHQHHVEPGSLARVFNGVLGEERVQKLQPLLGRGLEVVGRAVSAWPGWLFPLEPVTLPVLGSEITWDLRAIELEKHGKPWEEEVNAEALKRAEDSAAEWILSDLEEDGRIFKDYGLLRVRYKVTEEGDCPWYTRGSVAWLCKEHVQRGLEAGILESYSVKFYNPELN